MRAKPIPPTSQEIWAYRLHNDCGIFTAKDKLTAEYNSNLLAWLVEAVEYLLKGRV